MSAQTNRTGMLCSLKVSYVNGHAAARMNQLLRQQTLLINGGF